LLGLCRQLKVSIAAFGAAVGAAAAALLVFYKQMCTARPHCSCDQLWHSQRSDAHHPPPHPSISEPLLVFNFGAFTFLMLLPPPPLLLLLLMLLLLQCLAGGCGC
jgi:hypothetical protein